MTFIEPSWAKTVEAEIALLAHGETPEGWHKVTAPTFDEAVTEAFRVGAKYLFWTDYGKALLAEWKRANLYDRESFAGVDEYLKHFNGHSTAQLLKYYLSPDAIEDGGWRCAQAWTSDLHTAYLFESDFRPQDAWILVKETKSGRGAAVPVEF